MNWNSPDKIRLLPLEIPSDNNLIFHLFCFFARMAPACLTPAFAVRYDIRCISDTRQKADCLRGNALAAACKSESFFRRGLHIDLILLNSKRIGNILYHLSDMRTHFRFLRNDCRIDILNHVAIFKKQSSNMVQKPYA